MMSGPEVPMAHEQRAHEIIGTTNEDELPDLIDSSSEDDSESDSDFNDHRIQSVYSNDEDSDDSFAEDSSGEDSDEMEDALDSGFDSDISATDLLDLDIDENTTMTSDLMWLIIVAVVTLIPCIHTARNKVRAKMVYRYRPSFDEVAGHSLQMNRFDNDLRMTFGQFLILKEALRPTIERDKFMGNLRNGAIAVDVQLALTLRMLAGGEAIDLQYTYCMHVTTIYCIFKRVVIAINDLTTLEALNLNFPTTEAECSIIADGFKARSTYGIISHCVGAADGLFVQTILPAIEDASVRERFFSGHKMAIGVNCQAICDHRYRFTAFACNSYGSVHDKKAFDACGFQQLIETLPKPYYIVGDNAYEGSDKMLVPCPGSRLGEWWDVFNFFQSQTRMHVEQSFGIFVRKWGILWRKLEFDIELVPVIMMCLAKLHNYCIGLDDMEENTKHYKKVSAAEYERTAKGTSDIFESPTSNKFRFCYTINNNGHEGSYNAGFEDHVRALSTYFRDEKHLLPPEQREYVLSEIGIKRDQDKAIREKHPDVALMTHIAGTVEERGFVRPSWNKQRNPEHRANNTGDNDGAYDDAMSDEG